MRRVPGWLIAAIAAALLVLPGCGGSSGPPPLPNGLTAGDVALLHSVGGLEHLDPSDLTVLKELAIYQESTGKLTWTKVISLDGANSPILGTAQFLSYMGVAQSIGDTGGDYPLTMTKGKLRGTQLGYTVGHQQGEHFILLVNNAKLFAPVAKHGLKLGHSSYGETVQPDNGKLTLSLVRVVPDTSISSRELQVDAAATETCNAILRATVDQPTAALFDPKYVPTVRVEDQEDLCNSIGRAARYATVDHLSYAAYQDVIKQGLGFPWLVGTPLVIGVDQGAYDYFK